MRKFAEVLEEYLEERDCQNSDYYDGRPIDDKCNGRQLLVELAKELDDMVKNPITTVEFRYLTQKNQVTSDSVREYATTNEIPLNLAKKELENSIGPLLQYRLSSSSDWHSVPQTVEYVLEYRNEY